MQETVEMRHQTETDKNKIQSNNTKQKSKIQKKREQHARRKS